ncbi:Protein Scaf11 [Manis pentadactyla]|nr:Protein Scaf11 [Manis pentadactyla]
MLDAASLISPAPRQGNSAVRSWHTRRSWPGSPQPHSSADSKVHGAPTSDTRRKWLAAQELESPVLSTLHQTYLTVLAAVASALLPPTWAVDVLG